jgi:O-antigen ligase
LLKTTFNFRLLLVCALAASVGLPIGFLSLAKFMLFMGTLIVLLNGNKPQGTGLLVNKHHTATLIFFILASFAASLMWTTGSQFEALNSLSKYGKLLILPIFLVLIKNRKEAFYALTCFVSVQFFIVLSAWLLYLNLPVPWAVSRTALMHNTVFSSYLDEGLMAAVFASLCWHLRIFLPSKLAQKLAICAMLMALFDVFFILEGRSGHVTAIFLISLAVLWELPKRYRLTVLLLPFVLLLVLHTVSPKVQARLEIVKLELQTFSLEEQNGDDYSSSSGTRLFFWSRAAQAIAENPWFGSGIGSWSSEFNRIEKQVSNSHKDIPPQGNPHQEYLHWGVQLGIPGVLMLVALMASILRDTLGVDKQIARATQSCLAALAMACMFNSSIYDALIGDFFCISIGLLLAMSRYSPLQMEKATDSQFRKLPA